VHWAATAEDARRIVVGICKEAGAMHVTKAKSMVAEEVALSAALKAAGIEAAETDLGDTIIQLRDNSQSPAFAPPTDLNRDQAETDHTELPPDASLVVSVEPVLEARAVMREQFLRADVGITGANFLIAETGSSVTVTNEGNSDLTQLLPRVHIVLTTIEKIVPTLSDVSGLLRVLARSATGQEMSSYTTFSTGPRRDGDPDGPEAYHVVLLDNGRSEMLGSELQEMLRCIRCGACTNHCPVYSAIGSHAYGWVYPGPMGAVLAPQLIGVHEAGHLPNASSFCGRCEHVCPVKIPLPKMMRHWREREFEQAGGPWIHRSALRAWTYAAKRPRLYRLLANGAAGLLAEWGKARGRFRWLPLAGSWLRHRDLPAPPGRTFHALWRAELHKRERDAGAPF
jgi:L-lactate dehydrogenase complex protein LldF